MAKRRKRIAVEQPATCGPDPKWQAEDDVRTLERAEEVRADPARMKRAAGVAKEKASAMNRVVGSLVKRGLISERQQKRLADKHAR